MTCQFFVCRVCFFFVQVINKINKMSSSKKLLLAKLKKDMASKKASAPKKPVSSSTPVTELVQIHKELVDRVLGAETTEAFKTVIQTHVNFYPNDKLLLKVIHLSQEERHHLFLQIKENEEFDLLESIKTFTKSSINEIVNDAENTLLETMKQTTDPTISILIGLDEYVFDPLLTLEFYSDSNETEYCKNLLHSLTTSVPTVTNEHLRKLVESYMYNHRYDEILGILQNEHISDEEKQVFVTEHIKNQYESTRSKQFFVLIWTLVEKKVYPFKKQLDSLLYRFVQDKKFLPQIRKSLTMALDVLIHQNRSDKYLSKFFLTKHGLQKFKTMVLPKLDSEKQSIRYIRSIIRNEFEHSYLYQQAPKISWKTYLSIFQTSSFNSIESQLLSTLRHNRSMYVEKIVRLLQTTDDLKTIRAVIFQFISTYKPSERKQLSKLLTLPRQALTTFFQETLVSEYLERLKDVQMISDKKSQKSKSSPVKTWTSMESEYRVFLEKSRLEIPNFHCILIQSIHHSDITKYVDREFETNSSLMIPNDKFYHDCVHGACSQNNKVFQLNGIDMSVYYYLLSKEIVIQNENMFENHVKFITNQMNVNRATTPIEYFRQFSKLPLLNHRSDVMTKLRNNTVIRFDEMSIPNPRALEQQLFSNSSSLQDYLKTISRIILVTDKIVSPFFSKSNYFLQVLKSGYINMSNITGMLMSPLEHAFCLLYPEYFINPTLQPILLQKADVQIDRIYRSLIFRAFTIENPMSRLPIVPTEIEITDKRLWDLKYVTDVSTLYISSDNHIPIREAYHNPDISSFFLKDPVPQYVEEMTDNEENTVEDLPVNVLDPFHSFLQVALDYIEEL